MNAPTLSVVMIVKDEESRLARCIDSVRNIANEVIVVDTGSTDNTREIAKAHGAVVIASDWQDDFSYSRNISIRHATSGWLLWLDADDIVPQESHAAIKALASRNERAAYSCVIENTYEGRPGQTFRQVRLFPAGHGIHFEGRVHESLSGAIQKAGIPVIPRDFRILHTGYDKSADRAKKTRRNQTLLQAEYNSAPEDPAVLMELGNTCFQMKEYENAVAWYQKVEQLHGVEQRQRDIHKALPVLLGVTFLEMGRPGDAKKWFQTALTRAPDSIAAHYYLGQIALQENDPDTLLSMFEKVAALPTVVSTVASDITGMKANAYAFAGNLHFVRGNFARALELFAEADKKGLPAAFQYDTAVEAAKKAGRDDLAVYFKNKASSPKAN